MGQNLYQQHHKAETIVKSYLGQVAAKLFSTLLRQKPISADVIIFLQGDRFDRIAKVQSLFNNSFADSILITGNNVLIGRGKRREENDVHLLKLKKRLINKGVPETVISIDERSMNTLDQAINTIKKAKEQKWLKMLVVASPFHVLRAYLTFVRQAIEQGWKGNIVMQCADKAWEMPPGGREKPAIEILKIEMEKIKKYASDLATIEQAKDKIDKITNKK